MSSRKQVPADRERAAAAAARRPPTSSAQARKGRAASPWNGKPHCSGQGAMKKFRAAERAANCTKEKP